jgi:acetyl esterase/lipase
VRRGLPAFAALAIAAGVAISAMENPPSEALWPMAPPGGAPAEAEIWAVGRHGDATVRQVQTPRIYPFPADAAVLRPAVVICPGGGFNVVVIEREGWAVARALSHRQVAAFPITYRHHDRALALLDAQRALRWVRAHGICPVSPVCSASRVSA